MTRPVDFDFAGGREPAGTPSRATGSGQAPAGGAALGAARRPHRAAGCTRDRRRCRGPGSVAEVARAKRTLLVTFRRDGTPVPTPVWAAAGDGVFYVRSERTAGKVKRLRNDPRLLIAPCTVRGKPLGAPLEASGRMLAADEEARRRAGARQPLRLRSLAVRGNHGPDARRHGLPGDHAGGVGRLARRGHGRAADRRRALTACAHERRRRDREVVVERPARHAAALEGADDRGDGARGRDLPDRALDVQQPAVFALVRVREGPVARQCLLARALALEHGAQLAPAGEPEVERRADALGGQRQAVPGGVAAKNTPSSTAARSWWGIQLPW